eukprot:2109911-Prymnesium_polylepis.3
MDGASSGVVPAATSASHLRASALERSIASCAHAARTKIDHQRRGDGVRPTRRVAKGARSRSAFERGARLLCRRGTF